MTTAIEVRIWGKTVGYVAADPSQRAYAFEYDRRWSNGSVQLAPLTMPLQPGRRIFVFPDIGPGFQGLPGFLADALPDAFGNQLIDAWMAEHGLSRSSVTVLDRLAYMGKRAMGALEFRPTMGSRSESAKPLEMGRLVDAARQALSGTLGTQDKAEKSLRDIIRVGTSAGGARAKAVIALNPDTREIRSGQFDVPSGFEHWLLKFDVESKLNLGVSRGYGRIERAYSLMAEAAGIEMAPCDLLEENGRAHFMTKRFDREGNRKHHIQSLCAMSHVDFKMADTHSYEQLFMAIEELKLGDPAKLQAFRRMVFNFLASNCDDHTKNFAFRLKEGASWELTPAYDVTFSHDPDSEWVARHQMSVNGKFEGVRRADFLAISSRFAIPAAKEAIHEVERAVARWREFAAVASVPADRVQQVQGAFTVP